MWTFLLLFLCVLSQRGLSAERLVLNPLDIQHTILGILKDQLTHNRLSGTSDVIDRVARETGLSSDQVVSTAKSLLDSLVVHQQGNSHTWKRLTVASSKGTQRHSAALFLSSLLNSAQKILLKEGNYDLKHIIRDAAQQGKMPDYQSHEVLLQSLDYGLGHAKLPAIDIERIREPIQVFVKTHSSIPEPQLDAELRQFFVIHADPGDQVTEDFFINATILNLHNELYPLLKKNLEASESIKDATEQSYGKDPQYTLSIWLDTFDLIPIEAKGEALYVPQIRGSLILSPVRFEYEIFRDSFEVLSLRSGRSVSSDGETQTNLTSLIVDIAREVRAGLERNLPNLN